MRVRPPILAFTPLCSRALPARGHPREGRQHAGDAGRLVWGDAPAVIRNPVPWPNGARCAACFTLDMDAESILYLAHPQRAHSMVSAASMLRYGPDVAVPRILDTYRHYDIRQTSCPRLVR